MLFLRHNCREQQNELARETCSFPATLCPQSHKNTIFTKSIIIRIPRNSRLDPDLYLRKDYMDHLQPRRGVCRRVMTVYYFYHKCQGDHRIICLRARKCACVELALLSPPFPFLPRIKTKARMAPPIASKMKPTFGWNTSQAIAVAKMQSGIEMRKAARKMAKPTMPEIIPPMSGMKPSRLTIGEKKRQIPKTMQAKERILTTRVKHSDFSTDLSKISSFVTFSSQTYNKYSIGFSSSAQQAEMQQQQQSGTPLLSLLGAPSQAAMSKLLKVGPADLATRDIGPVGHRRNWTLRVPSALPPNCPMGAKQIQEPLRLGVRSLLPTFLKIV